MLRLPELLHSHSVTYIRYDLYNDYISNRENLDLLIYFQNHCHEMLYPSKHSKMVGSYSPCMYLLDYFMIQILPKLFERSRKRGTTLDPT